MNIVEWKPEYSVAVESIDKDHQKLFEIVNRLFRSMSKGEGSKIISSLVDELQSYTIYHFNREETFFRLTNYPNAYIHQQEHASFIVKVKDFKQKINSGNVSFSPDLLEFLRDWLMNHIMNSDKMYSEHLKKYGIT